MMKNIYKTLESSRIKSVANDYRKKGYEVIVEPSGKDVPSFLKNFRPDLIAVSDTEKVLIEVKTKLTLSKSKDLQQLADLINKHKGWRFELVVTNPKKKMEDGNSNYKTLNHEDIKDRIKEVMKLSNQSSNEASFLLAWATLEAAMRKRLVDESIEYDKGRMSTPLALIKMLYSYGITDKTNYNFLLILNRYRSLHVHGYKSKVIDHELISRMVKIIKNLIDLNF